MVAVKETVTVINRSGKVVSSSKHLVNIFNEAKSAYNERKAELKAQRRSARDSNNDERRVHKQLETLTIDDDAQSYRSSRRSSRRGSEDGKPARSTTTHSKRPPIQRGVSDGFYMTKRNPSPSSRRSSTYRPNSAHTVYARDYDPRHGSLARRHTEGPELQLRPYHATTRRASLDDIDMDLAYGELPPPLPARKYDDEVDLRVKMSGLQRLLDECNCIQHSVTATIDNLQKNPDALAAVALTLAEISNLVSKLAPGALMSMKGSFPAIVALLASPEFAIAAGVGVGVTIIALGGYKIVKKIQAKRDRFLEDGDAIALPLEATPATPPSEQEEAEELRELDRIEVWRRGIAEADVESLAAGSTAGSSVEGELVTPLASRTLIEEGRLTEADFKSRHGEEGKARKKKARSSHGGRSSKSKESGKSKSGSKKEPSGLRMLFKKAT